MFKPSRKFLKQLWRSWIRNTSQTPLITMRDVQNEAAEIGGSLFASIANTKQSFFWYPEIAPTTPKIGEFVYIQQKLATNERDVPETVSHIHYAVAVSATGEVSITKSLASKPADKALTYRALDDEELKDLASAVTLLKNKLQATWS